MKRWFGVRKVDGAKCFSPNPNEKKHTEDYIYGRNAWNVDKTVVESKQAGWYDEYGFYHS